MAQHLIPGPGVTCGLSLLLVLVLALSVFSGVFGFPSSTKLFDWKKVDKEPHCGCVTVESSI